MSGENLLSNAALASLVTKTYVSAVACRVGIDHEVGCYNIGLRVSAVASLSKASSLTNSDCRVRANAVLLHGSRGANNRGDESCANKLFGEAAPAIVDEARIGDA